MDILNISHKFCAGRGIWLEVGNVFDWSSHNVVCIEFRLIEWNVTPLKFGYGTKNTCFPRSAYWDSDRHQMKEETNTFHFHGFPLQICKKQLNFLIVNKTHGSFQTHKSLEHNMILFIVFRQLSNASHLPVHWIEFVLSSPERPLLLRVLGRAGSIWPGVFRTGWRGGLGERFCFFHLDDSLIPPARIFNLRT